MELAWSSGWLYPFVWGYCLSERGLLACMGEGYHLSCAGLSTHEREVHKSCHTHLFGCTGESTALLVWLLFFIWEGALIV